MKYSGFVNERGQKQVWGQLLYNDGSQYEGEWNEDKCHGFGKKTNQDNS